MIRKTLIVVPFNKLSQRSPGATEEVQENASISDSAAQTPSFP